MTLSYTLRLLCVLIVAAGFVLASSQLLLATAARRILCRLDALAARGRERILYCVQIAPPLLAAFLAIAVCLPAYLHGETNRESESVSGFCLLVAAAIAVWFGVAFLRGLRVTLRTVRFARACRRSGQAISHDCPIPVLAVPDPGPPIALIGFLRPTILVSHHLLRAPIPFANGTLDLALAHELSHAAQGDNWKLLTLTFLPRLGPGPWKDPWMQPWQVAADCAADEDAVHGDPARSLLLAEALIVAARMANSLQTSRMPYIATALTSADAALGVRIDRLLGPGTHQVADRHAVARPAGLLLLLALAALTLLAAAACSLSPWIYALSERLLHLGA